MHTYAQNRTYTVRHIVSNGSNSDTAIIYLAVNCSSNLPLKADFQFNILDTVPSRDVTFRNTSQGTFTNSYWDFGDGNISSQKSPTHIYSSFVTTTYNVTLLIVNTATNQRDSITKTITLYQYDSCKVFKAYFTAYSDSNCMTMKFNNYSHYSATNFVWDFGNGYSSTSMNPSHTYSSIGYYTVKMKASNGQCADSQTQTIRVTCRTCFSVTASIALDVDSTNPSKAKLYNYSYGVVNSHFWDFGDGNTSTAAAPTHVYTSPGQIQLMYVVRDTASCYDTAYLNFEIDSMGNIKRGKISFTLEIIDRTNSTSVKTLKSITQTLKLYPNPSHSLLNISNTSDAELTITIYNSIGQSCGQLSLPSHSTTTINTESWSTGLHLLKDSRGGLHKVMKE
jgi:PKD repeat protein